MRFSNCVASLGLLLVIGCGDSGAAGGAGAGGGAGEGGNGSEACTPPTLCLDIVEEGAIPEARFAVVWFRLEGDVANDPSIAMETTFDPSASRIEVDMATIPPPPEVDKICERRCEDVSVCPDCTGDFEGSVAYLMVVVDEDMSGAIDPAEVGEPENIVGIANAALGWSNDAWAMAPLPFDEVFPDGTSEGVGAYRIDANGAFIPASLDDEFSLKVGPDVF